MIDDVWREAQLKPFLRGGPNCVRLVTTRLPGVLPAGSVSVPIDEMRAAEAAGVMSAHLPGADQPTSALRLAALAKRLGFWAQMLAIANGWLRERVAQGEPLPDAIAKFERRLARDGPFVFNPRNETQRNKAIRLCIEASVQDLAVDEASRFAELAVLPEDEDVPLAVIEALWAETGGLDEDDADDLVRRLDGLSLLQSLDLGRRTLRLHDNMLWYLRDRLGAEGLKAAHAAMVRAIRAKCGGVWNTLPFDQTYGWRFLILHLRGADEDRTADDLLSDYAWIKARLHATDARSLYSSYFPESADADVRRIGRAIGLSLPTLMADRRELARQLFGRLGDTSLPCAIAARLDPDCRPRPRWPGLTPPGAERLSLRGHEGAVQSAAFSPDGARIVTASDDRTARIWDAATGAEIAALRGHERAVAGAAFSPDGARIVTASDDRTARIWDAATGAEIAALRGHEGAVRSAAFSPDGARIVTASDDRTARIWDAATGAEIAALRGHEDGVLSAAFSPDGARIVTASDDRTARIWDAATGAEIAALRGHEDWVRSAAFSPDGARIVTASDDRTARIWDAATGAEIAALRGHENSVRSAAFSPDGARIVTASARPHGPRLGRRHRRRDRRPARAREIGCGAPRSRPTAPASSPPPRDRTARIWDAATGAEIAALRGHERCGAERRVLARRRPHRHRLPRPHRPRLGRRHRRRDRRPARARGWGAERHVLARRRPHRHRLRRPHGPHLGRRHRRRDRRPARAREYGVSAAFSPDGARIVTASYDRTARLWEATTGAEIAALRGHENSVWSACVLARRRPHRHRLRRRHGPHLGRRHRRRDRRPARARGSMRSAAFSPDGARIVTASSTTARPASGTPPPAPRSPPCAGTRGRC